MNKDGIFGRDTVIVKTIILVSRVEGVGKVDQMLLKDGATSWEY